MEKFQKIAKACIITAFGGIFTLSFLNSTGKLNIDLGQSYEPSANVIRINADFLADSQDLEEKAEDLDDFVYQKTTECAPQIIKQILPSMKVLCYDFINKKNNQVFRTHDDIGNGFGPDKIIFNLEDLDREKISYISLPYEIGLGKELFEKHKGQIEKDAKEALKYSGPKIQV